MNEWNITLSGDYLWTNMIVGEVFPTATTPSTWSVWQDFFSMLSLGDIPTIERIAGRPYLNYSLMYAFALKIMRTHERVMNFTKDSIGVPPSNLEIPVFPISMRTVLFQVLPREVRNELKKTRLKKNAPAFLAMIRGRCHELRGKIETAANNELIALWTQEIRPLWQEIHPLQDKMNEDLNLQTHRLKSKLVQALGEEEANMLLTTISSVGELASLGPLMGLSKLVRGEINRSEYLQRYGHRGSNENEIAEPRPYEDSGWLDRQLSEFIKSPVDVDALIAKRDVEAIDAWEITKQKLDRKKKQAIEAMIEGVKETNALREATRAELTRLVGTIRALFLRAGDLVGIGDEVFFLTVEELTHVLSGDPSSLEHTANRRDLYERYRALPPLPSWIRGRFDPFAWAADPYRQKDIYAVNIPSPPSGKEMDSIITGQPGSAGQVEGMVRRIDTPDEGDQLQPGEILVARTTNVGWTPLFPRAAAVITDVGGSLSHAAIVARELGIPAVVGCGDATTRLHNGDWIHVDGGRGTIEILGVGQPVNA